LPQRGWKEAKLATNEYILQLMAQINATQSDQKIQKYIADVQQRIANDPKSALNISVAINPKTGDQVTNVMSSVTNASGNATKELVRFNTASNGTVTVLKAQSNEFQKTAEKTDSFNRSMIQSIQTAAKYAMSVGLVYAAINQLKEGIQYIIDLNKEMIDIQMVTGDSDEKINKMAQGYNSLAKEMGSTTIEIAKGSLEFIRQGKTAEETAILIKNSTMMSKLGNLSAMESSEALTAIMNGFKMSAEETGQVVSKLVSIDNIAATSVKELSTAMQYSAASAQQAGIDFDHLAAFIK
jgi:5-hydroxyisourate hydrolase-like protein (transthyretin family)